MSIRPCGCDNVRNVQYPGFTFYRGKITRVEEAGSAENKINSAIFLGTGQPVDFYACRRELLGFGLPVTILPPPDPLSLLSRVCPSLLVPFFFFSTSWPAALWADISPILQNFKKRGARKRKILWRRRWWPFVIPIASETTEPLTPVTTLVIEGPDHIIWLGWNGFKTTAAEAAPKESEMRHFLVGRIFGNVGFNNSLPEFVNG